MPEGEDYQRTTYAVWEITLQCNLACSHCGSRAGETRANELSTAEAFDLIHQMAEVGIREVTLIGGEAFLRKDWLELAAEITRSGMRATMTTGGYGITSELAEKMKAAGIATVGVSIDGLEATHDRLRGRAGSWQYCFRALERLRAAGIKTTSNCQINRLTAPEMPLLYELVKAAGIQVWQLQLTVPMGNAADNAEILLQPSELLDLYPMIAHLARRALDDGLVVQPGNNIGYYGPYERFLRSRGGDDIFWHGCQAGINTLGIEADGAIKGCPSLPTTVYTGGNIRDHRLRDIVENHPQLRFNETQGTPEATSHLWGFCKGCAYAEICRAGCSWTSHVFFDKRGNNPYCHHRSLTHAASGLRERVVQRERAAGLPFDNGVFDLLVESCEAPAPPDPLSFSAGRIRWPEAWLVAEPDLVDRLARERDRTVVAYQRRAAAS